MKNIIKELASIDLLKSDDCTIRTVLNKLHAKPIPASIYDYPENTTIVRGRPIEPTEIICYEDELSYVPAKKNKTFQRASTPHQTMFYGIVSDTIQTQQIGCLHEISDCLRNPNPKDGEYYAIISYWTTKQPISLFTIINPEHIQNKSKSLIEMSKKLDEYIEAKKDILDREDVICLLKFMHNQYNKKIIYQPNDYWIPAFFTEDLIKPPQFDGVLYRSAQCVDEKLYDVLCLAIKPESVDAKLEFRKAQKLKITLRGKKATLSCEDIEIKKRLRM